MRFAAIADVHGNTLALEAVLADIAAQGITEIVNLGDHVSGPLEAARTADLLMARAIVTIAGDQDRRLVELEKAGGTTRRMDFRQLERRHLDWLASLPATLVYRDDVLLCHGAPMDDAAYWLDHVTPDGGLQARPLAEIEAAASGVTASLILCAHTHIPRVVRLSDGRLVVNPGSVGCPGYTGTQPVPHAVSAGSPDACYALLVRTPRGWSTTLRYVPYDHMAVADIARRNGATDWAEALATGWVRPRQSPSPV